MQPLVHPRARPRGASPVATARRGRRARASPRRARPPVRRGAPAAGGGVRSRAAGRRATSSTVLGRDAEAEAAVDPRPRTPTARRRARRASRIFSNWRRIIPVSSPRRRCVGLGRRRRWTAPTGTCAPGSGTAWRREEAGRAGRCASPSNQASERSGSWIFRYRARSSSVSSSVERGEDRRAEGLVLVRGGRAEVHQPGQGDPVDVERGGRGLPYAAAWLVHGEVEHGDHHLHRVRGRLLRPSARARRRRGSRPGRGATRRRSRAACRATSSSSRGAAKWSVSAGSRNGCTPMPSGAAGRGQRLRPRRRRPRRRRSRRERVGLVLQPHHPHGGHRAGGEVHARADLERAVARRPAPLRRLRLADGLAVAERLLPDGAPDGTGVHAGLHAGDAQRWLVVALAPEAVAGRDRQVQLGAAETGVRRGARSRGSSTAAGSGGSRPTCRGAPSKSSRNPPIAPIIRWRALSVASRARPRRRDRARRRYARPARTRAGADPEQHARQATRSSSRSSSASAISGCAGCTPATVEGAGVRPARLPPPPRRWRSRRADRPGSMSAAPTERS